MHVNAWCFAFTYTWIVILFPITHSTPNIQLFQRSHLGGKHVLFVIELAICRHEMLSDSPAIILVVSFWSLSLTFSLLSNFGKLGDESLNLAQLTKHHLSKTSETGFFTLSDADCITIPNRTNLYTSQEIVEAGQGQGLVHTCMLLQLGFCFLVFST